MNQTEKKTLPQNRRGGWKILRLFTHNWLLKLLSAVLAVVLWSGLISQDNTITREKIFTDVGLTVSGGDSLINNKGLIVVSGIEDVELSVDLWAAVPQNNYQSATASNYNPKVDLSRITEAGEQTVKITTSSTSAYGSVTQLNPESITVQVDEYVTNYLIPVTVNIIGELPEGMGGSTPTTDPSTISVSGPKTVVDQISHIVVDYDLSSVQIQNGTVRDALPFRFVDAEGNEVESSLLKATSVNTVLRTVTVSQLVYPIQEITFSTHQLITGEPAEGYYVESVELYPDTVLIGGDSEALERVGQLFIENAVSVEGESESFSQSVKIKKPTEISYLSSDTVNLNITISPIVSSRTFEGLRVTTSGLKTGLKISSINRYVDVIVTGFVNDLKTLKPAMLTVSADFSEIQEAGSYEIPYTVTLESEDGKEYTIETNPSSLYVMIVEK